MFPLVVDDRDKPFGWGWNHDSPNFDLSDLSVPEALTFALVEQHLDKSFPPATLDALQLWFKSARQALREMDTGAQTNIWLCKVRTIAPMQALLVPQVDAQCQREVYDALMRDRQLKLSYKKRDVKTVLVYESVHPLAVIQRRPLIYLVCLFAGYDDVRMLAMHRMQAAEMQYLPSRKKTGF